MSTFLITLNIKIPRIFLLLQKAFIFTLDTVRSKFERRNKLLPEIALLEVLL